MANTLNDSRKPAAQAAADERAEDGMIGLKLRLLRQRSGRTLKDVSQQTGISIGHLSQLERDLASPSVKTLQDISHALGVNISWFFSEESAAIVDTQYVVRGHQRHHIRFADGVDDYQLNSPAVRQLGLLFSTFQPGASSGDAPYTHDGEEAGYIVEGELELWIDNKYTLLTAGDSFSFPSTCLHRYRNVGTQVTAVIWAMTPPTY